MKAFKLIIIVLASLLMVSGVFGQTMTIETSYGSGVLQIDRPLKDWTSTATGNTTIRSLLRIRRIPIPV